MLTFTFDERSKAVTVYFDGLGRSQLFALLEQIATSGDHVHLIPGSAFPFDLDVEGEYGREVIAQGVDIGMV